MAEFAYSEAATVAMRTAVSTALRDLLDAGAGPGEIRLYTASNVLLATATLADPAGTIDATGALSLAIAAQAVPTVDGALHYATMTDSDGQVVMTLPAVASNVVIPNALALPSLEVVADAPVYLLNLTIS